MKVDDGKECLCSSLAINCFQLGCFLHKSPRCSCAHDNRDWMARLRAASPEKKLRDVVIPGTHDSASVTIPNFAPFAAVGLCQNVSILDQLRRGARYLDLRVGGKTNSNLVDDIFICHGMLKGGRFADVLDEIDMFLFDNPSEFVIVEVIYDRNKHAMSTGQLLATLQLLSSTFEQKVTDEDVASWFRPGTVTLGDIGEKERNTLLLINDQLYGFDHEGTTYDLTAAQKEFGCHANHKLLKNRWHNTSHAPSLLKSNEAFLCEAAEGDCDVLVNSQFVMTPQPPRGLADVVGMLLGMKSLRPVSLARELYGKDVLERFLRDNSDSGWNVVLLDFIDLCPQLVRFLLGLNSSIHLKIKEATATKKDGGPEIDVTETARSLRSRDCSLYFLDFKKDLGLDFAEGTFRLKAQYEEENAMDIAIPFDRETEYLVCLI
ncbi:hypothetical protein ACHAXT_002372 [Thalassiosira profunda]